MIYRCRNWDSICKENGFPYPRLDFCGLRFPLSTINHLMYVVSKVLSNQGVVRHRIVDHNLTKILLFPLLSISEILERSNFNSGVLNLSAFVTLFWAYMYKYVWLLAQPISQGKSCRNHGLYDRKYQLSGSFCSTLVTSVWITIETFTSGIFWLLYFKEICRWEFESKLHWIT